MKTLHAAALSLAVLAGCATPPAVRTPDPAMPLPPTFGDGTLTRSATNENAAQKWWMGFGEPTLDALVEEALEHNNDLRAAAANVRAAQASATIAGADKWPQLSASMQGARQQQVFVGFPIPGQDVLKSLSTSYGLSLGGSWELDLWNRLGQQERAALAELQATQADHAGARLSVAALTTNAWLDLSEARTQLALTERTLEAFRNTESLALERYRKGLIPSVELHLTRTSAEGTAALAATRRMQVERASRQLEVLAGRYPSGELLAEAKLPESLPALPAALPSELLVRRPDLIAAERRFVASGARVSQAKRGLLPRITLTGSGGRSSNQLGDLLKGDFSVWSLAAGVMQPLFQGGRLLAQVKLSASQEDVARARYVQTALSAFSEVEIALALEAHFRDREDHLRIASESADRAWRLAEDRYRQGIGSLLEVLEAQRLALSNQSQLITVRTELRKNRVALHRALGGGFDLESSTTAHASDSPIPASE